MAMGLPLCILIAQLKNLGAACDSPQLGSCGSEAVSVALAVPVVLRELDPLQRASGVNGLAKLESEMRPIRVGIVSCCALASGIGTAELSGIVPGRDTIGAWLLPSAYLVVLGILLILLCSLCLIAVFGSPGRRGWALAVLCVLLDRKVPPVPPDDGPHAIGRRHQGTPVNVQEANCVEPVSRNPASPAPSQ